MIRKLIVAFFGPVTLVALAAIGSMCVVLAVLALTNLEALLMESDKGPKVGDFLYADSKIVADSERVVVISKHNPSIQLSREHCVLPHNQVGRVLDISADGYALFQVQSDQRATIKEDWCKPGSMVKVNLGHLSTVLTARENRGSS